jgi:long-subunit fatty acid transport protein
MVITEEDILNAKKAFENKEEVADEATAVLYAKALTRNSKKFPELPQKVKYVALKQESGKYLVDWRSTETCSAEGRP